MAEQTPPHGGQLRQIAAAFNLDPAHLLDFSANINPEGPPRAVLASLRTSLDDVSTLTSYPDLEQTDLKQAIARYTGVAAQNIAVANGFVPLLEAALRLTAQSSKTYSSGIKPVRRCTLPVPAFNEYRPTLVRAAFDVIPLALDPTSNFSYNATAILENAPNAILLANPQNPSGVLHDRETMLALVQRASERDILVLLDEAFIDYAPEHSLVPFTDRFPNLIVFRSVTKFHGIPGLRAAYAVSKPSLTESLTANLAPWPITTLASQGVIAAVADPAYPARTRARNLERRSRLHRELESLGLTVYPSAANFLLFRLPEPLDATALWRRLILEHHIVLRDCSNYEALGPGHLRAAVRTDAENHQLVAALQRALGDSEP